MELKGKKATWLELAVAPTWRLGQTQVRIHSLDCDSGEACHGITVDGRWLCANDGRLTVFGCRESATRFLELLRIERVEDGEPSDLLMSCGCEDVQCLRLGARGLRTCELSSPARGARAGAQRVMLPPRSRRPSFESDFAY